MEDSNHAGMAKSYYYLIIIKQFIEETISYISYKKLFLDINSTANIWNIYDDESVEEE